jgi:hypothetical protein
MRPATRPICHWPGELGLSPGSGGDGNPLDAWGGGTFVTNLPQALSLLDASPDHDIIVFCRDNSDDPAFDTPELVRRYIDLFTRAAAQSRKPHYLVHSRPGVMDRHWWRNCASTALRSLAGTVNLAAAD